MRGYLREPDGNRFRISQEGLPVVDENLIPVTKLSDKTTISDDYALV
jgi:hypothetical protein